MKQNIDVDISTIGVIARITHAANKAYCKSIGDNTQLSWDEAPDWQKESAINGVVFHLQNSTALPSASHDNWYKEKEEDGWVFGPEKDPEKKEHPCMVPYSQLPLEQKMKDYLFSGIVKSVIQCLAIENE